MISRLITLFFAAACVGLFAIASELRGEVHKAPSRIELHDQFEKTLKLQFPTTNLTVLIIADRDGAADISAWIGSLKASYGDRVALVGIADLSKVPALLRRTVRRKFVEHQKHPVMMDWKGEIVRDFDCAPHAANLYLLDSAGHVLKWIVGKAEGKSLSQLREAIDTELARSH